MKKIDDVKKKVSDKLSLPKDIVLNMPIIKIIGDKEILIENHSGLLEYSLETIKLKSNLGDLILNGTGFEIKDINDENIFILGSIESLNFVR